MKCVYTHVFMSDGLGKETVMVGHSSPVMNHLL